MKEIEFSFVLFIAFMCFNLVACDKIDGDDIDEKTATVITIKRAGTLADLIPEEQKHSIEGLSIIGSINGSDVKYIREMAYLSYLNLENAKIVYGGDNYDGYNSTSNDKIGTHMFEGLTNLTKIKLPNNIQIIDGSAFNNCDNLSSLYIPDSAKIVGAGISGVKGIKEIIVSDRNNYYTSLDGVLFDKNKKKLILFPYAKSCDYKIPDGVTSINEYAFYRSSLTNITIPKTINSIGANAFEGCFGLKEIHCKHLMPTYNINEFLIDIYDGEQITLYVPTGSSKIYIDMIYYPILKDINVSIIEE